MIPGSISITVRCYAELNDGLPASQRQRAFVHTCPANSSIDDVLRALGIPTDVVDLALVNGASSDLEHRLLEGDYLSLYPVFESFDIGPATRIREGALRRPAFVLDVHLGKLAHLLRMLGFDALYRNTYTDRELVDIAGRESRTVLSKDRALVADRALQRGMVIRSQNPRVQLLEVMDRFELYRDARPFTRCIECNSPLKAVAKEVVQELLPPLIRSRYAEYNRCSACGRVYWKGSHYARMMEYVQEILAAAERRR